MIFRGCLLWVPLANVYGRRPILLIAQAIACAAGCGSAVAKSFGTIIVGRCFVGLGVAAGNVLTVNLISDIFCRESAPSERFENFRLIGRHYSCSA